MHKMVPSSSSSTLNVLRVASSSCLMRSSPERIGPRSRSRKHAKGESRRLYRASGEDRQPGANWQCSSRHDPTSPARRSLIFSSESSACRFPVDSLIFALALCSSSVSCPYMTGISPAMQPATQNHAVAVAMRASNVDPTSLLSQPLIDSLEFLLYEGNSMVRPLPLRFSIVDVSF